jgi:hypothetical protein
MYTSVTSNGWLHVDNTSDANKPNSVQLAALNLKANLVSQALVVQ